MQPAKHILQSQYSLLIYISIRNDGRMAEESPEPTIFVSEGYWQNCQLKLRDSSETIFLGNSATDLRAGVPLIVFMDLSRSFHLPPDLAGDLLAWKLQKNIV